MSQNSEITTSDAQILKRKNIFDQLLSCKCGNFHKFSVIYTKKFKIIFFCGNKRHTNKIEEIYNNNKFCFKCNQCQNIISVNTDYLNTENNKIKFICNNCFVKKHMKNFTKLVDYKGEKENISLDILNNLNDLKNVKEKNQLTEFYNENLIEINEFEIFLKYLFFTSNFFPTNSQEKKIINNFFEYLKKMIEISLNNKILYDIYHFKREANIYADIYEDNEFLSDNFNKFYSELLNKCSKKKYLSLEMLKYVHENLFKLELALPIDDYILIANFFKENNNKNITTKIYKVISDISKSFLEFKSEENKINFKNKIYNLENKVSELNGEIKIEKYLNSFFNVPGEFSLIRKNINFILGKIIKNNANKLKFNKPNIKIIKLTIEFIGKIKENLHNIIVNKKDDINLKNSISEKLKKLEEILTKYQNALNSKYKNENKKIENLEPPLIKFTDKEKQFLKDNYLDIPQRIIRKLIEPEEDEDLQIVIDYLFSIKEIGNETLHLNDKEKLKYYSFTKNYQTTPQYNKNDELEDALKNIKKIIEIIPKISDLTNGKMIDYTFKNPTNKFMISENKMEFLLSFLNLKRKGLKEINEKYKTIKNEMEITAAKI